MAAASTSVMEVEELLLALEVMLATDFVLERESLRSADSTGLLVKLSVEVDGDGSAPRTVVVPAGFVPAGGGSKFCSAEGGGFSFGVLAALRARNHAVTRSTSPMATRATAATAAALCSIGFLMTA